MPIEIDSAGTGAWHVGSPPDKRAQATAKQRGVDLSGQRARQVHDSDFEYFDLILAMDQSNLTELRWRCPKEHRHKLRLFLEFATGTKLRDVPDPYYGHGNGFEQVLDLVENGARGLLAALRSDLASPGEREKF